MSNVINVAVVIIKNQNNEVLIAKRNQNQVLANHWEFPGGKVEPGESIKQAAIREVQEEVDLRLFRHDTIEFDTTTIDNPTNLINITYYMTSHYVGTPTITDQLDLKWVPIKQLNNYKFPQANQQVIAKLQREARVKEAYQASSPTYINNPQLIHNYTAEDGSNYKVITELIDNLNNCKSFIFVVAFITESGVSMLTPTLNQLQTKQVRGIIYVGDYLTFTEPKAIRRLQQFKNITVKFIQNTPFHAKGYLFEQQNTNKEDDIWTSIIGSSNLTSSALTTTNEWNVKVTGTKSDQVHNALFQQIAYFDTLAINDINQYQIKYEQKQVENKLKQNLYTAYLTQSNDTPIIYPNIMQTEALDSLKALRTNNQDKGLIVSSTGTGKTILSALDVKQVNPKRMLFVVHRETIAKASLETYKRIMPNKSFGLLTGNQKDLEADYLFATIQTLVKKIDNYKPNHFDYIVIDEVHHGGAKSYQKLVSKLTPNFMLGITATPERSDGFNIYEMFDYNLAYEYRLDRAMADNLLAPFHYFGVSDITIDNQLVDEKTTINNLTSEARVKHIIEKIELYGYHGEVLHGLMFVSNTNEAVELSVKLNSHGYQTVALTSNDSQQLREQAIEQLEKGQLDYIITVDIFNEGIDIPKVNQVVMLRPTNSAIVYVQQLGRGLRKTEDKDYVTIIDFIGNYKNNYLVPVAIASDHTYNKDKLKKEIILDGINYLQGESIIQFEQIVQDKLIKQITSTKISSMTKIKQDYNYLKQKYNRVPRLIDFKREGLIDPSEIIKTDIYSNVKTKIDRTKQLSKDEQLYLEYCSRYVMSSKRSAEIEVLEAVIADKQYTPQDDYTKNACMHLAKEIFTKISDEYKYQPMLSKIADNTYIPTEMFSDCLNKEQFTSELLDILEVAKLNNRSNTLQLHKTYTRKEVYKYMLKDFNNGYQVTGYTVFDDVALMFITLDDTNSFTEYTNELLNNSEITWYSKVNRKLIDKRGNLTQEGMLANNQVQIHIMVKRTSSEEFYYLGIATTQSTKQVQINNKQHIQYTYKLDNSIDSKLYKYLTYKGEKSYE